MKQPPFLMSVALMFWGWQTQLMIPAIILSILLESSRFFPYRWEFSITDISRISDLCTVIFIGIFAYLMITKFSVQTLFVSIQWAPLIFSPILIIERYSISGLTDMRALSLILRNRPTTPDELQHIQISLIYPYIGACVLSASAANVRNMGFYAGLFIISVWALISYRSKRYSLFLWSAVIIFAGISGYIGQIGIHRLQMYLEQKGLEWFTDLARQDANPYQSNTAIGRIAELKPSGKIVFRVKPEQEIYPPFWIREASYIHYRFSSWFSENVSFKMLSPQHDETTWLLHRNKNHSTSSLTVTCYLKKGKGLLKLPGGTYEIHHLPVVRLEMNSLGTVRVEDGPLMISYKAKYTPYHFYDKPPDESDLIVPKEEIRVCQKIVDELKIESKNPEHAIQKLTEFFYDNFQYSLAIQSSFDEWSPISKFLETTRAGHCEYFATASVLLLRAAGIPARYATGYLVSEFSPFENQYIVRNRHAHAWTLAYINGSWRDIDMTPPSWIEIDANQASFWEPILDVWDWLIVIFYRLRMERINQKYLWGIGLLVIAYIFFRIRFIRANRRVRVNHDGLMKQTPVRRVSRNDSLFYQLEAILIEAGMTRFPCESLLSWLHRIEPQLPSSIDRISLQALVKLHYRFRFDPKGLDIEQEKLLRSGVEKIIDQLTKPLV